jgi:hypothetical protein
MAALAGLAVMMLSACASGTNVAASKESADPVQQQVHALLSKYDLQAAGAGTTTHLTFPGRHSAQFALYSWASDSIGLDLRSFAGKAVDLVAVPLAERSQGGAIEACFVIDGAKVAGAYLVLDEYAPASCRSLTAANSSRPD